MFRPSVQTKQEEKKNASAGSRDDLWHFSLTSIEQVRPAFRRESAESQQQYRGVEEKAERHLPCRTLPPQRHPSHSAVVLVSSWILRWFINSPQLLMMLNVGTKISRVEQELS
jgi:hypothetical protein